MCCSACAHFFLSGGLALPASGNDEWWAIMLAVIMCVIGVVYCLAGCACQDDRPKAVALKSSGGWHDPDTGAHSIPVPDNI